MYNLQNLQACVYVNTHKIVDKLTKIDFTQ